jgi:hypothetical protein
MRVAAVKRCSARRSAGWRSPVNDRGHNFQRRTTFTSAAISTRCAPSKNHDINPMTSANAP